jgi:hypothetical protein
MMIPTSHNWGLGQVLCTLAKDLKVRTGTYKEDWSSGGRDIIIHIYIYIKIGLYWIQTMGPLDALLVP